MKYTSVFIVAILIGAGSLNAAELRQEDTPRGSRWIMENNRVRITIDPARGARVEQFQDKAFELPLIRNPVTQGLFVDHTARQNWPGELWERTYDAKPLMDHGEEVVLQTSTTLTGEFRTTTVSDVAGLILRKTFRLRKDEAGLRVEYSIENPTDTPRRMDLWIQNIFQLGLNPKRNVAVRPATAGVYRFVMPDQPFGETWSRYHDSIAAWHGVVDPETQHGVIFFQDYDYLDAHYNAGPAFTTEWFMSPITILPGKNWTTHSRMVSRRMNTNIIGVTPDFWISVSLTEDEKAIEVTINTENWDTSIVIDGELHEPRLSQSHPIKLSLAKGVHRVKLPEGAVPPIFIEAQVGPEGGEQMYVAEFLGGEHFSKNEPLPGYPPLYQVKRPLPNPIFPRPTQMIIDPKGTQRVLLVEGMGRSHMNLRNILKTAGYEVKIVYEINTALNANMGDFPTLYDDILRFGTIVFNNVDAHLLSMIQRQLLSDYVHAGGRLLLFGGTAMTAKNWSDNPLKTLTGLPPSISFSPAMTNLQSMATGDANLIRFLPETNHIVTWRGNTEGAIIQLNRSMLIVTKSVGKGRFLACGLAGIGQPAPADYWQSTQWQQLVAHLITLLHQDP